MSKPYIHAQSSVRKFGGQPEDYEPIHAFMDCSKGAIADNRQTYGLNFEREYMALT